MSYSKITFLLSFSLFQSLDQLRSLCQVYTKPRGLKSHSNSGNVMKLFNYKCTWVHYILFTVYYHKDKDNHTYNISSLKAKVKQQCTSRAEMLLLWTQLTHKQTQSTKFNDGNNPYGLILLSMTISACIKDCLLVFTAGTLYQQLEGSCGEDGLNIIRKRSPSSTPPCCKNPQARSEPQIQAFQTA